MHFSFYWQQYNDDDGGDGDDADMMMTMTMTILTSQRAFLFLLAATY